jgi:hypothetical protein
MVDKEGLTCLDSVHSVGVIDVPDEGVDKGGIRC